MTNIENIYVCITAPLFIAMHRQKIQGGVLFLFRRHDDVHAFGVSEHVLLRLLWG